MGLIVSVERLEGILFEYAPEIAAEVLAKVWPIAKDSKSARKVKVSVPMSQTGPNEVYEQRCDRCHGFISAGAYAMAATSFPSVCCMACWGKHPESKASVDRVTVVAA